MSHCPILNPKNKYLPLKEEIHHAWFIRMIHEWSLEASSPCFTTTSPESYAHLSKLPITRSLAGDAFLKPPKNIAQSGHTFKKKNELSSMVTNWPVFRVLVVLHLHQKIDVIMFFGRLQLGNLTKRIPNRSLLAELPFDHFADSWTRKCRSAHAWFHSSSRCHWGHLSDNGSKKKCCPLAGCWKFGPVPNKCGYMIVC